MTDTNFVKMFVFKNRQTERETRLFLGLKKNDEGGFFPVYHLASKEIPITGEFTGFPTYIMKEWMEKIGYQFIEEYSLNGKLVGGKIYK